MEYIATLTHNNISRSRSIRISGSIAKAKLAAAREFGDEPGDCSIKIFPAAGAASDLYPVASRYVSEKRWRNRSAS